MRKSNTYRNRNAHSWFRTGTNNSSYRANDVNWRSVCSRPVRANCLEARNVYNSETSSPSIIGDSYQSWIELTANALNEEANDRLVKNKLIDVRARFAVIQMDVYSSSDHWLAQQTRNFIGRIEATNYCYVSIKGTMIFTCSSTQFMQNGKKDAVFLCGTRTEWPWFEELTSRHRPSGQEWDALVRVDELWQETAL